MPMTVEEAAETLRMHGYTHPSVIHVLHQISFGPMDTVELAQATGYLITTVQRAMKLLRKHKICRIVDWEYPQGGGAATPTYGLGSAQSRPRRAGLPLKVLKLNHYRRNSLIINMKRRLQRGGTVNMFTQLAISSNLKTCR